MHFEDYPPKGLFWRNKIEFNFWVLSDDSRRSPIFALKVLTGHRSEALQGYKRESDDQLATVSNIVQGQTVQKLDNKQKVTHNSDLQIAENSSGRISLNIDGANCNIIVNYNK